MTRIYLAASWAAKDHMRWIARQLISRGHKITSSWIYSNHTTGIQARDVEDNLWPSSEGALENANNIMASDLVAVFTDIPSTTGGYHVEFGIALGLRKAVVVVGNRNNIFQAIPNVGHFDNETDFLKWTETSNAPKARTGKNPNAVTEPGGSS